MVFPGAEHSRFSHSIGVMHIMSRFIDKLKEVGCEHLTGDKSDEVKQKLRLAALLHDIGHYPLSHLGEKAFEWVAYTQDVTDVRSKEIVDNPPYGALIEAGRDHENKNASHEALGKLILTAKGSEIGKLLEDRYDPSEIARIFNTEDVENDFYIQLISSTLDCDRLDYMLRDSISTGTPYGQIDLEYIIQNILWNSNKGDKGLISFHRKAITAVEHFISSRYFFYNIIYHKTIMGFELMAKTLLFSMVKNKDFKKGDYGSIVHSLDDIKKKIKDDPNFLANFNDEYFWYYLELFEPKEFYPGDTILSKLRDNLLTRIPMRPIYSIRTAKTMQHSIGSEEYNFVTKQLIKNTGFLKLLADQRIDLKHIGVVENSIQFEKVGYMIDFEHIEKVMPQDRLKLVKIGQDDNMRELITINGSLMNILSQYQICLANVYALADKGSILEQNLIQGIHHVVDENCN
ncbi:MAG: HD domain-containing protein [candidate division Zixibacteria bacterium]|nr:HD domain-containing protein [candidate division Zixibacteria bacterium]